MTAEYLAIQMTLLMGVGFFGAYASFMGASCR